MNKTPLEKIISGFFILLALVFGWLALAKLWIANLGEFFLFLALSLLCCAGYFDPIDAFRLYFLGRVDRIKSEVSCLFEWLLYAAVMCAVLGLLITYT